MEPVYINVNKPYEEKHKTLKFVKGVHFPKKLRTKKAIRDGKEIKVLVRHKVTRHYVEHEQDENGELLYVNPCGGIIKESELDAMAELIMGQIEYCGD